MKSLPTPIRADSLSRQVFGILKEAVFDGKFQQGELIAEIKIAKWLNVSQATVREALVLLEQNGLVIRQKNRKTQVNRLTTEEVRDRVSMRIALEALAAVNASEVMNGEELEKLCGIAEQMPPSVRWWETNRHAGRSGVSSLLVGKDGKSHPGPNA